MNIRLSGIVRVCRSPSCRIDGNVCLFPSLESAPFCLTPPVAVCSRGGVPCDRHQTSSPPPGQPNSVLPRVDITGSVRHVSQRFVAVDTDSHA